MRTDALCNLPVMLGEHHLQNGGKTSQLNPQFVAEMMGFSPDWTVLPFKVAAGIDKGIRQCDCPTSNV